MGVGFVFVVCHAHEDVCECLPNCREEGEPAKYSPITVQDMVTASYKERVTLSTDHSNSRGYRRPRYIQIPLECLSAAVALFVRRRYHVLHSNWTVLGRFTLFIQEEFGCNEGACNPGCCCGRCLV
jgi:hypothetical protein